MHIRDTSYIYIYDMTFVHFQVFFEAKGSIFEAKEAEVLEPHLVMS